MMAKSKNAKIAALIEWLIITFASIIKMIRDGVRSEEDLEQLITAMQGAITVGGGKGRPLQHLKKLVESLDPEEVYRGWVELYRLWGLKYKVPRVPYNLPKIERERRCGRILVYLHPHLSKPSSLQRLCTILFPDKETSESVKKLITPVYCISDGGVHVGYHVTWHDVAMRDICDLNGNTGWGFVESMADAEKEIAPQNPFNWCYSGMIVNWYVVFARMTWDVYGIFVDGDKKEVVFLPATHIRGFENGTRERVAYGGCRLSGDELLPLPRLFFGWLEKEKEEREFSCRTVSK